MGTYIVDLPCIVDNYIDRQNSTTSFGSATTLLLGGFEGFRGNDDNNRYITIMKFNFSSLPAGKSILSAYLRLYSINHVENYNIKDSYNYPFLIKPLWYTPTESDTYMNPELWWTHHDGTRIDVETLASTYLNIDFMGFINNTDVRNKGIAIAWEGKGQTTYDIGPVWQIGARNSANPPMIRVTYTDTIPEKPTAIDPIGLYVQNSGVIQFKWVYNNSTGGSQYKFDLKWSTNSTTWTTVSQTTGNNYYDMPANTLPTGNIYWKVITYNNLNEASPESNVNIFYSIGAPAAPVITEITNTNTPKPTIVWTSSSQQVFQVQIIKSSTVVYDTGDIPSISIKSHTITTFLEDGTYVVKVRVKNEYDLYSSWASAQFTIETPKPVKPPITLKQNKYSIDVTSNLADNSYLLLFRADINSSDFKCVAKSTANVIKDYTIESNKEYKYLVRAVSKTGTYLDGEIKSIVSMAFNKSIISPVSNLSNIFEVKYNLNERPVKNIAISTPNTTNYFSGRKYPVVEYSEHLGCGITLSFFIKSDAEYQQLLDILYLKEIVLYRDGRRKFYGNISGINVTDHFAGYTVNFSINQTDYSDYLEV
ncbi:DNRLRE domain-containing protein [Ruminiclostridium cellobioparum]|uniref:DNRLRE domain-containing protein n=1 Tax=Ruminiclostridium cellobioparum TaxID=29355 RepID=UPI0004817CDA|nr:DNRLRE domain-containing protein [Ruminiclostridium cellobioparum]